MANKKIIESLMNEKLNRLSQDFELNLIRLLKTLSLISQSKDILEKHVEYLRGKSTEFQNKLARFTIMLLELEKEVSELSLRPAETDEELNGKLKRYVKSLKGLLNDYLIYAREINDDLEKKSREYIDNLEVSHKFYTLELRSTQIELDSRLRELQSNLSKTLIEISSLKDKKVTPPEKSEENLTEDISNISEYSIKSLEDSVKRHKRITFSLISVIFLLLLGLWVFNNGREITKIKTGSKQETVPYKETSKEVGGEVTKETKKVSEEETAQEMIEKTPETQSTKTEEKKEKIQQLSSRKRLLTVTGLGGNIREGPGKRYSCPSVVKEGEVFERLDEELGNWIKIKTQDGTEGWISKKLVKEIAE